VTERQSDRETERKRDKKTKRQKSRNIENIETERQQKLNKILT
jgi:hypothetical protein